MAAHPRLGRKLVGGLLFAAITFVSCTTGGIGARRRGGHRASQDKATTTRRLFAAGRSRRPTLLAHRKELPRPVDPDLLAEVVGWTRTALDRGGGRPTQARPHAGAG
jgi:hypothetical protein